MPFRQKFRGRMRPRMVSPIVSFKHQRNETVSYLGSNANNIYTIYTGVQSGTGSGPQTVPVGEKVYSVDVSVNFIPATASAGSDYSWMLVHYRSDQDQNVLFSTPHSSWSSIGLSNARNQVVKSFMGVTGSEDSTSARYNIHIRIPKMWHRMREGDLLLLTFNAAEAGILSIGTRYKSYS